MRTETEVFDDVDGKIAQVSAEETISGSIFIRSSSIVELTKEKAKEFALQMLEMCEGE